MCRWTATFLNFLEHSEFERYVFPALGYCVKSEDSKEIPVCISTRLAVMAGAACSYPSSSATYPIREATSSGV